MSNPESTQPAVRPADASANGHNGSGRDVAAIEADLRATREHLAGKVDEIVGRAHPKALADRGTSRAKGLVLEEDGKPRMDRIVTAAGGVVGAVAVVLVLRALADRKRS